MTEAGIDKLCFELQRRLRLVIEYRTVFTIDESGSDSELDLVCGWFASYEGVDEDVLRGWGRNSPAEALHELDRNQRRLLRRAKDGADIKDPTLKLLLELGRIPQKWAAEWREYVFGGKAGVRAELRADTGEEALKKAKAAVEGDDVGRMTVRRVRG